MNLLKLISEIISPATQHIAQLNYKYGRTLTI